MVLSSITQEGQWQVEAEDQGAEGDEPILIIPFGGINYSLSMDDVKEMAAGMRERHLRWRDRQPPPPDFNARLKEWAEILKQRLSGKQQFYMGKGIPK